MGHTHHRKGHQVWRAMGSFGWYFADAVQRHAKRMKQFSIETGVYTYIVRRPEGVFLTILDEENDAFTQYKLNEDNMLRLISETAHELLVAKQVYQYHAPDPPNP